MPSGKVSGLGNRLYVGRTGSPCYDLSGDIGSISSIESIPPTIDVSGIESSEDEYLLARSKGQMVFSAFFNPDPAIAGYAGLHTVLAPFRAAASQQGTFAAWLQSLLVGADCAFGEFLQLGYKVSRAANGALTVPITLADDGNGPVFGDLVWSGSDTAATVHAGLDLGRASAPMTIIANTLASPSVFNVAAHGFTTGDSAEITGSNSTPSANGMWAVTVVDSSHFTVATGAGVALNCSAAGTAGSVYRTSQRFGGYLGAFLTAFTGTSLTPTWQDSADNVTFNALTGSTMAAMTLADGCRNVKVAIPGLIRRYLQCNSVGTMTAATWVAMAKRRDSSYD